MTESTDVIIVGGGIVGASLACALGSVNIPVAIIDAKSPPENRPVEPEDQRVLSITRASERLFGALGVWDGITLRGISPVRSMKIWDAGGDGSVYFDCAEIGEPLLAHVIGQRVIQAALWARLAQFPCVQVYCPASPEGMTVDDNRVEIGLGGGHRISARLLVGADGKHSRVRDWAGLPTQCSDYRQHSIVATVSTGASHRETAWQRFLPEGPLAFLPLHDGRSSIVWSTSPSRAQALLELDEEDFCKALEAASGSALGAITGCGPRQAFPLERIHADRYVTGRVALAGDAAHAIHPLAGQGVNLGLMDVAALAEVVFNARASGRDPGGLSALRRYERWRKGDNLAMQAAMDAFKGLFAATLPPVPLARNLGLDLVDCLTPVKNLFMRHASGLAGDLPGLARGIPLGRP